MLKRTVSGAIFVVLVLGATLNQYTFIGALLVVTLLGLKEFYQLVKEKAIFPSTAFSIVGGGLVYLATIFCCLDFLKDYSVLVVLLVPITLVVELYRNQKHPFANAAITVFGWLYVAVPLAFICSFSSLINPKEYNFLVPIGYFLLIWINDTGAYVFGKSIGKRKIFERISPNKTWEGTISGILLAVLTGYFLGEPMFASSGLEGAFLGLLISASGTLGDMVESMFKRSIGVKDSGNIMPGHGGVLDRFDGVIFSSPMVFLFLYLIGL